MAELAELIRSVAEGEGPALGSDLAVVAPPDERSVGVLSFAGCNVVSLDVTSDWVRCRLDDDLSAPLQPPFLAAVSAVTGRVADNLDLVLVARATGRLGGIELTEQTEFVPPLHPRLARALDQRIGVRAWHCPGGMVTIGRGVAGRWEVSLEVEPALRGFGLGRGLFTAARGLLPAGEYVWAQVAPGNAASVRAALAAGFQPVGAEVLLRQGQPTFGPFDWFVDIEEPTREPEAEPVVEPVVESVEEPAWEPVDEPVGGEEREANTVDQSVEGDGVDAQVAPVIPDGDDDLATNMAPIPTLSVLDDQTSGDESVD